VVLKLHFLNKKNKIKNKKTERKEEENFFLNYIFLTRFFCFCFLTKKKKTENMIEPEDMLSTAKLWAYLEHRSPHRNKVTLMKMDALRSGQAFVGQNLDRRWAWNPNDLRPVVCAGLSDYAFDQEIFRRYSSSGDVEKKVKLWVVTNCTAAAMPSFGSTLLSLPIGLTNDCHDTAMHPVLGDAGALKRVFDKVYPGGPSQSIADQVTPSSSSVSSERKRSLCYGNFSTQTCPEERGPLAARIAGCSWVTKDAGDYSSDGRNHYLRQLATHQFVLAPRGNGIDTHRIWEAIYMGAVPVVRFVPEMHRQWRDVDRLPILFVDDWSQLTEDFLRNSPSAKSALALQREPGAVARCGLRYWCERVDRTIEDCQIFF
jgi:hypothetical protein